MKSLQVSLLFLTCGFFVASEAYRILGIFPSCSRSHQMMFEALSKGLAKRGHQIDIVTCFPPKKPIENFTVLMNTENSQNRLVNNWTYDKALSVQSDVLRIIAEPMGNDLCNVMGREELQRIIKNPPNDPPYDLVMTEGFSVNCFIGLGEIFKVPVILMSTTVEMPWLNRAIGNPRNLAFFPSFFVTYVHPLTFWERVQHTFHEASVVYRYNALTGDTQTALMRKYLRSDMPHIRELEKKVTLALINSYHTLSGVRPTTPGFVEVGGLHIEDDHAELSKDLKKWLDDSKDGVVYFTLGSMILIETMPHDIIRGLYAAFEKIAPIRVLMKVVNEDKLLPGRPKNLLTSSWIPQVAVLAHKNTRLFITHGGLMSTQEALYYGVPLIVIPLFGDQIMNARYYQSRGMAVLFDFNDINAHTMSAALDKVLNDPSYTKAAKRQSELFRDRPMTAMETAIFWVEYTIRNGPEVLRSPLTDLTWYQNDLLDVYLFFILSVIFTIYAFAKIVKLLVKVITKMISSNISSGQKNRKKRD